MTLLRRLFLRLLAMLRPAQAETLARQAARNAVHVSVSSYSRRYPGRTPAGELRRNLGWVAVMAARSHRDRRA